MYRRLIFHIIRVGSRDGYSGDILYRSYCMPLGNLNETVYSLIVMHPDIEFYYGYQVNEAEFHLDTKEMREMLGDIPLNTPEISSFIRDYLEENESDINRMQNYPG